MPSFLSGVFAGTLQKKIRNAASIGDENFKSKLANAAGRKKIATVGQVKACNLNGNILSNMQLQRME